MVPASQLGSCLSYLSTPEKAYRGGGLMCVCSRLNNQVCPVIGSKREGLDQSIQAMLPQEGYISC